MMGGVTEDAPTTEDWDQDAGLDYCVTMLAPDGLAGISAHLHLCRIPLVEWRSGFNGKHILREGADLGDDIEFDMDSSTTDTMFASGSICGAAMADAEELLASLSTCLQAASVPHEILLDDTDGNLARRWAWRWPEQTP